jgi:hypothetical protein
LTDEELKLVQENPELVVKVARERAVRGIKPDDAPDSTEDYAVILEKTVKVTQK